ncbi:unnamed protein product [Nesidiocoris tenuis]|uniref:Uncharacterized protein n=1 Tax=Nesidiocoris tenuis TaxID=355587 RepID=A0A6H5FWW2_9HEMI|nr:unnamed protein product [Nesidiocoris tenuis]CAA9994162.1 unnamed protein product [Nesidiocoris tenuis]
MVEILMNPRDIARKTGESTGSRRANPTTKNKNKRKKTVDLEASLEEKSDCFGGPIHCHRGALLNTAGHLSKLQFMECDQWTDAAEPFLLYNFSAKEEWHRTPFTFGPDSSATVHPFAICSKLYYSEG